MPPGGDTGGCRADGAAMREGVSCEWWRSNQCTASPPGANIRSLEDAVAGSSGAWTIRQPAVAVTPSDVRSVTPLQCSVLDDGCASVPVEVAHGDRHGNASESRAVIKTSARIAATLPPRRRALINSV